MSREMKDSGISWMGDIPQSWNIERMKNCFVERTSGAWGDEAKGIDGDCICLRIADFDYEKFRFKDAANYTVRNYTKEVIAKLSLQKGDILIEKSGGGEKTPVGRTVVFDKEFQALFANFMDRLRCTEAVSSQYIQYVFVTFYKNGYSRNYIKQTTGIQNLDLTSMLASEPVPMPSLKEQHLISDFLDVQCIEIASVLNRTRASIEEYKKLKQAVITEAVTKGVRGKHPMKDSGVEWIGSIPEDWQVFRVANLYREASDKGNDELPILTVSINSGVSDRELSDEESERVFVRSEDRSKYKRVQPGDLVYNMMRAWQGAFGAVRVDGMVSPAYVVARPMQQLDSRYVEYLFRTPEAIEEMHRYSYGVADFRLRLYWPQFRNIRMCVPPYEEQVEIADYIDKKVQEILALIKKKEQYLVELENYKKSLIYEYVTGKKEVPPIA